MNRSSFEADYSPHITYAMLSSVLAPYEILHEPENKMRSFRWAASFHGAEVDSYPKEDMLFVCTSQASAELHKLLPNAFILVMTERGIPKWVSAAPDQAIVVKCSKSVNLVQRLQNYFIIVRTWKSDVEHLLLTYANISRVMTQSQEILGAPLVLSDSERNIIARSERAPSRKFVEVEQQVVTQIEGHRTSLFEFKSDGYQCSCLCGRVYIQGPKPFNLLAVYEGEQPSQAHMDTFYILMRVLNSRFKEPDALTKQHLDKAMLLEQLAHGAYIGDSALTTVTASEGITSDSELRLLSVDFSAADYSDRERIRNAVDRIYHEEALITVLDDCMLLLLHSENSDDSLSNLRLRSSFDKNIYAPFGACTVASQVFQGIRDVKYAYDQTRLVLKYRHFVDAESQFMLKGETKKSFYPFEDCFLFMLIDADNLSPELRDFCLSHTILEKLIEEDKRDGTNNARILTMYQFYGHKATVVAEKLHMHRNTVLYHLDKIQKRFDLDLEDPGIQERLMLDTKALNARLARTPSSLTSIHESPLEALRYL